MNQPFDLAKMFSPQTEQPKDENDTKKEQSPDKADEAAEALSGALGHIQNLAKQMRAQENRMAVGSYIRAMENFSRSMQLCGELLSEAFIEADQEPEQTMDMNAIMSSIFSPPPAPAASKEG